MSFYMSHILHARSLVFLLPSRARAHIQEELNQEMKESEDGWMDDEEESIIPFLSDAKNNVCQD